MTTRSDFKQQLRNIFQIWEGEGVHFPANKGGGKVPRLTAVTRVAASAEHTQRINAAFDRLIAVLIEQHLLPQQLLRLQGEEDHVRLNSS